MTEQMAQFRLRLTTCYRGPMPGAVTCIDHADCQLENERRSEQYRAARLRHLWERGTPVPPKSRRRP